MVHDWTKNVTTKDEDDKNIQKDKRKIYYQCLCICREIILILKMIYGI